MFLCRCKNCTHKLTIITDDPNKKRWIEHACFIIDYSNPFKRKYRKIKLFCKDFNEKKS